MIIIGNLMLYFYVFLLMGVVLLDSFTKILYNIMLPQNNGQLVIIRCITPTRLN